MSGFSGGAGGTSGAFSNARLAKVADYTVANADKRQTLALGGTAYFTLTLSAASGYDSDFAIIVTNEDTGRAKSIAASGVTTFFLWPGQSILIVAQNNAWIVVGRARWRLAANLTVYVRSDGANTNDGLANTAAGGWLTRQKANDMIAAEIDLAGFTVTVQVGDATWTATLSITPWVGGGAINWTGNTGTPANCLISITSNDCFMVSTGPLPGVVTIDGFKLQTTTGGNGLTISQPGKIVLGANMTFGAIATTGMDASGGGQIFAQSGYTITAGGQTHINAHNAGLVNITGGTVTLTGTPAFTTFANASASSTIISGFTTYSGAATGQRYNIDLNSVINTFGGGATYFPGNSAGASGTGGQYA